MDQNNNSKKKNKVAEYITGRGFYTVIGICLAVVVAAAWLISTKYGNAANKSGIKSSSGTQTGSVPISSSGAASYEHGLSSQLITSEPAAPSSQNAPAAASEANSATEAAASASSEVQTAEDMLFVLPCNGEIIREHSGGLPVYSPTFQDWRLHSGVDIAGAVGTPVRSMAAGVVKSVYEDVMWGTCILIAHNDGYESLYCGLGSKPTVAADSVVECGQVIGSIGQTSKSEVADEPHLHFSLTKDGLSVDPISVIASMSVN